MRFRKNLERLGMIMAYEISHELSYSPTATNTPLGKHVSNIPEIQPVLIPILRAGIPFYQGFAELFDHADCGFVGAARREGEGTISIQLSYLASPSLSGKDLIIIDPMLATGRSIAETVSLLLTYGTPRHIYVASVISAPEGIEYIEQNISIPHSIFTFSVDEKLNDLFYIVPGLGDAGDLSFGEKK